jgi:hypothetical protein
MKIFFKLGFLALALSLSLSACDFFSSKKNIASQDSIKIDSIAADSAERNEKLVDSTKKKADSSALNK